MSSSARLLLASLLACASPAAAAPAAARDGSGATVRPLDLDLVGTPSFTTFTAHDGVPEAAIVGVAIDADGFPWLASAAGPMRFVGHRWETADWPERTGPIHDLFLDHGGTLWASLDARGLARYDGERWRLEGPERGLPIGRIRRVTETTEPDGSIATWALTWDGGLLRRVGERWEPDPGNARLPPGLVLDVARTEEIGGRGRLWIATFNEGVWFREEGGDWSPFRAPGFDPSQVEDLLVTRQDGREELWIATFSSGLFRLTQAALTSWTFEKGDLRSNRVYRVQATATSGGGRVVWAATRSGLVRVHDDRATVLDRRHGLPSDVVRNLGVWRSPSGADVLWIATDGGVARSVLGANPWQTASLLGANSTGVFGVVVEPDGEGGERLWVGSTQDGLGLFEHGRWRSFGPSDGETPGADIRLLVRAEDEAGRAALWIGGSDGELFRADDEPRFARVATPWEKHSGQAVMDLLIRKVDGRYERWFATRQSGIYRWRGGQWTAFRPEAAVGQWRVVKLLEQIDREGRSRLWASTNQGLARFDDPAWTLLGAESGLPTLDLTGLSLLPDSQGRDVLWVGSYGGGLLRIDVTDPLAPRLVDPDGFPKPPDSTVYGALRDSAGRIYIATNNGVQRLEPDSSGGYRQRLFGRRDGMVHEECNTNAQLIDEHDRYWVGTLGGLAVYDPAADRPDRARKSLRVLHVQVDGTEVDPAALSLPPGTRELRIEYALPTWHRESESRFRSQLLGYEPEPTSWSRQPSRVFGELPPGSYVLRVEARDHAGVAAVPLELAVEKRPAWWQRLSVRVGGLAMFLLAGPLFYLDRTRRLSRQKEELERVVATRTAELAAANDSLAQLSQEDPLTGLSNRRRLDEVLDEEWRRAARIGTPLSFLLLDIDHFKAYNDRLGHPAGDACLRAVARAIAAQFVRAGEMGARYGGEEFAVVLPGVDLAAARAAAERLRGRIAELALEHPAAARGVVTVSIGVAAAPPTVGSSWADLVAAADQALYRAKRDGRDRVDG